MKVTSATVALGSSIPLALNVTNTLRLGIKATLLDADSSRGSDVFPALGDPQLSCANIPASASLVASTRLAAAGQVVTLAGHLVDAGGAPVNGGEVHIIATPSGGSAADLVTLHSDGAGSFTYRVDPTYNTVYSTEFLPANTTDEDKLQSGGGSVFVRAEPLLLLNARRQGTRLYRFDGKTDTSLAEQRLTLIVHQGKTVVWYTHPSVNDNGLLSASHRFAKKGTYTVTISTGTTSILAPNSLTKTLKVS